MSKYYYIGTDNQRQGPVEAEQLPSLGVTTESYVWTKGMKDWDQVKNVRGLDYLFPQVIISTSTIAEPPYERPDSLDHSSIHPLAHDFLKSPQSPYEEKSATGWLIAAYIFAALGGYLGMIIGIMVFMAKEKVKDPNGGETKVLKYKKNHRTLGLIAAILSVISIFVWKFAVA